MLISQNVSTQNVTLNINKFTFNVILLNSFVNCYVALHVTFFQILNNSNTTQFKDIQRCNLRGFDPGSVGITVGRKKGENAQIIDIF